MLSTLIKEATKTAHQNLEKKVVLQLKAIHSDADYARLLKHFYAYFHAVEQVIKPFLTPTVLPDYSERRNSTYLKADIEDLGDTINQLPNATPPQVSSVPQALGALYVLEGSIMGGSIIVQMLAKHGIHKGVSFFSGYGAQTGQMWSAFIETLNAHANSEADKQLAIEAANATFEQFGATFNT